jgi:hypothetical protein
MSEILIGAVVGFIVSMLLAILQKRLDVETKIDENIRADRLNVYKVLWEHMLLVPLYPPSPQGVTYSDLYKLSETFRGWYFTQGGILLSEEAKKTYIATQQTLLKMACLADAAQRSNLRERDYLNLKSVRPGSLTDDEYFVVQQQLSRLRTQLTIDLMTRRQAPQLSESL